MSIIPYDFGRKKREAVRRFRKLLSLDALHETNIRANPVPYLERASERIYQLEKVLFDAAAAAREPSPASLSAQKIEVDEAEYQRLLTCRAIIERKLADLGSRDDA